MKIIFSLVVLGALAFIIRKLGLKKIEAIAKVDTQPTTKVEQETSSTQINNPTAKSEEVNKHIANVEFTESLELPLELQAILSAIKAKLHFSVDEDTDDNKEQDTNSDNDNNDYGNIPFNNDGGNGGGGGYFPYQSPVVTPVTAITTPVSAASIFSSILNTPIKVQPLPIKSFGNLSNIINGLGTTPQVTPTPTPNTPVINTVHTTTASSARTSNNHSYRHTGGRRRF
jgi:hypothetical protein